MTDNFKTGNILENTKRVQQGIEPIGEEVKSKDTVVKRGNRQGQKNAVDWKPTCCLIRKRPT